MNATTTLQTVMAWPVDDQLDFLFRAWDQLIENGYQPELTEELRNELRQRLVNFEEDPSQVLTWEQVESHVRRSR